VYAFGEATFSRINPDTHQVRDTFMYIDVASIIKSDDSNIIIRFKSGKEAQYLCTDRAKEIIEIITVKNKEAVVN